MENLLRVGVITSAHGIHGEVKVFPTTDDADRFRDLKKVILDLGKEQRELDVESVKYFKNTVILKLSGIGTRDEAEALRQKDLLVTRDRAVKLLPGEHFIIDLIGLTVRTDGGQTLGTLADVMQTGANDVYCVRTPEGEELLLPAIGDCILKIDLEEREMLVHVMDGLLDG